MYVLESGRYGDSGEYILTTRSIAENGSPVLISDNLPPGTIIEAKNEEQYALHFWAYSLVNVPVWKFLDVIGADTSKAFQITNSLLLFFFGSYNLKK
jgi:hypothetical protein